MSICGSCLPEPGKCPGKHLIALAGLTLGADISAFEITFKPRSYPTSIDEGTTVVIICAMKFCNFESCPLDTRRNLI